MSNLKKRGLFAFIFVALALAFLFSVSQKIRVHNEMARLLLQTRFVTNEEKIAALMLKDWMLDRRGLVVQKIEEGKAADSNLLESMGQFLEYAEFAGNERLKSEILMLIMDNFRLRQGYLAWRIEGGKPDKSTALIDELRIAKVLLARGSGGAAKKPLQTFFPEVFKNSLLFSIQDGRWASFYDGRCREKADEIALFYLDPDVLKMLAGEDERFREAWEAAQKVLDAAPQNECGFFPQFYDYKRGEYVYSPTVNMVENILTAMYCSKNGGRIDGFVRFLQRELNRGHLYNRYRYDGTPADRAESAAGYALACQLFMNLQDEHYADLCYKRMLDFQIKTGKLKGGFGDSVSETVYAFDQLEAMKTIRMKEGKQ